MAYLGLRLGWLIDALFPRLCIACGAEGDVLCRTCRASWRPAPPIAEGAQFSFFSYADPIARGLLQVWKYGFDERAWGILREEMVERIPQFQMWLRAQGGDALIPVPLFYAKRNERGFDQAIELASWCSAMSNLSFFRLVVRVAHTKPQAQKTKDDRLLSYLENPFEITMRGSFVGAPGAVFLVDDVYTTGATMRAVESVLVRKDIDVKGYISLLLGGS